MDLVTAGFPSHSVSFGPGLAFSPQLAHKINSCPKVDVARPMIKFVPIHVNNIDPSSGLVKRQAQSGPAKKSVPHTKPISKLGAFRAGGHGISTGPDNEGWRTIIAHPRLQAKQVQGPPSPASAGLTKLQRPVGLRHISLGMLKSATRQARPPEYDRLHSLPSKSSCHDLPTISKATGTVPSNALSSKVVTGTSGRNKPQKGAKRNSTSVDHGGKRHGGTSTKVGQGRHEGMSRKRGSGGAGGESSEEDRHPRQKRGITDVDVSERHRQKVKEKKTPAAKKRKTEGKKRVGKKLVNMDCVMTPETSKGGTIKLPFNFMSPHLGTSEDTRVIPGNNRFACKWSRLHRQAQTKHGGASIVEGINLRTYLLPFARPNSARKWSNPSSKKKQTKTTKVDQAIYGNPAGSFVHIDRLDPTMAKLIRHGALVKPEGSPSQSSGLVMKADPLDRYCEKAAQAAFARKVFEPLALTFRRQYNRAMENWRDITIVLDSKLLLFLRDGTVPSVKFGWGTELGSGPERTVESRQLGRNGQNGSQGGISPEANPLKHARFIARGPSSLAVTKMAKMKPFNVVLIDKFNYQLLNRVKQILRDASLT
ncbi:hypothetical protein BT69DRAFT_1300760 [Atractiella rhizophila]|nr:hypothetical protein BT69DRAFT_1300760 [Atractiella rhizophila]